MSKSSELSTSSIGATWPPAEGTNERLRGFYPEEVNADTVDEFVTDYQLTVDALAQHDNATRASLRGIATHQAMEILETEYGANIEAALPLAGGDYTDRYIVYLGHNQADRQASSSDLARHRSTLQQATTKYRNGAPTHHQIPATLKPRIIQGGETAKDPALGDRLMNLYAAFGFTRSQVDELIDDPNNTLAVLEDDNHEIPCTVLAESAQITILGKEVLRIVEITEAVTQPARQGEGYYTKLSSYLAHHIMDQGRETGHMPHALYGESNLSSVGVIFAAVKNGRRVNHFDAERLGLTQNPNFGMLIQNFSVNDGLETRPYNDFAISYYPLDQR